MSTEINFLNDDVVARSLESLNSADAADITASGDVTANAFIGDGSQLTNIPFPGVTTFACKAFMNTNNTVNNNTAYTAISVFPTTGGLNINLGGFTSAGAGITVPASGIYVVSGIMVYSSTAARSNPEFRFTINGVGQTESSCSSYIRNASGHNESSSTIATLYNMVAGDVLGLEFRQLGASGTVTLDSNSVVTLYRIG